MKKLLLAVAVLAWMFALGVEVAHARVRLNDAIQSVATDIASGFETGTIIAVVSMQADSARVSNNLIADMTDALIALGRMYGFTMVSRSMVVHAELQRELNFSMTGLVSDATAQRIGHFLGAQFIVMGELGLRDNSYLFSVRVIEVITGRYWNAAREHIRISPLADPTRFWSIGIFAGTSFAEPLMIGTLQVTLAPLPNSFIRLGCNLGFLSSVEGVGYFSIHPFAHYAFFLPFYALPLPFSGGGWHIGVGGGFMMAEYRFDDFDVPVRTFMADFATGFNFGNTFDISYTLRTDFSAVIHKISAGFTYRFQARSR